MTRDYPMLKSEPETVSCDWAPAWLASVLPARSCRKHCSSQTGLSKQRRDWPRYKPNLVFAATNGWILSAAASW